MKSIHKKGVDMKHGGIVAIFILIALAMTALTTKTFTRPVSAQVNFDVCLQDDHGGDTLKFSSTTGEYKYTRCADGLTLSGRGRIRRVGCLLNLDDDSRVSAAFTNCPVGQKNRGSASIKFSPFGPSCFLRDSNSANKTCNCPSPRPGQGTPPGIDPPAPGARIPVRGNPAALPPGARAHFPAYDGDPFFVTLPVTQRDDVRAGEVLSQLIVPILNAIGFDRGTRALVLPPAQGVPQPVAKFSGLAQTVAFEYNSSPALLRPKTQQMLDVFTGKRQADKEIDNALEMGEGMNFAQFVAGVERLAIQYPFQQVDFGIVGNVPIEHTHIVASRWQQQGVTTVYGNVFNRYAIVNRVVLTLEDCSGTVCIGDDTVTPAAIKALGAVKGVERVVSKRPRERAVLVLLPYGTDAAGLPQMRYTYRMILRGISFKKEGEFRLWLDAETGQILKLIPLLQDTVPAQGAVYNRDPGVGTTLSPFEVDSSSGGQYTLKLSGVLNRVDYKGDGYDASDVTILDSTNGSSATFANFNQAPINDAAQALCFSGANKAFQQVNFFGTIHRYYQTTLAQSIFTPFPISPWNPKVESASAGCNAWSDMDYGACDGYFNAVCPDLANNFMNFAHDNTVVGHELAHNITQRLTDERPDDWCGMPSCSKPVGWIGPTDNLFHDLADFWADHFESTNCTAGWVSKNMGGVDNSLYCLNHTEGGGLPRLHQVTVPFNSASPGDHFPEHRTLTTGGYANGQMGAAALWQARVGMRSKCRPSGLPQFGVRFQRALKETGFLGFTPGNTSVDNFRQLYDLETKMVDQWATSGSPMGPPAFAHNGPHTTNKVTAGFARAGLFLIPYQCLDGNPATTDATSCPTGENGGDAVIDIDDNDPADDLMINGVLHPEFDFLRLGGPAPVFNVWTGPRYKLDGAGGNHTINNPAPCNTKFRVEVSTDPAFPAASTILSPWIDVATNPTIAANDVGHGTWSPSATQWMMLQAGGVGTRIYYRARTRDAADGNERLSTMPGNGLWMMVPPPYAVITMDGRSDY